MRGTRQHRQPLPRRALLAASLGVALFASPVAAQDPAALAARRLLIDRARLAQQRGEHAAALEFATSALRIQSSASLLLFVAEAQSALGRDVEALGNVERCLLAAQAERAAPVVAQNCRLMQSRLRPRVAGLVTQCAPATTRIAIDDAEPVPCGVTALAAGAHRIEARAEGYASTSRELSLAGGETHHESITLAPRVEAAPVEAPPVAPVEAPPVAPVALPVTPPPVRAAAQRPTARRGLPTGAVALGVSGLALLAATPLLFFARDQAVDGCLRTPDDALACPDAETLADANLGRDVLHPLAIVSATVGGTALLGALLWTWRARSAPVLRGSISAAGAALSLEGRF